MTDYYMDTDAGSDANTGLTWAQAKLTFEGLLAVMAAGDRGFIQGLAADTAATSRTFTSSGTVTNPCIIIGVADGTTNEPPVLSDLAVTLPIIECTGATPLMTLAGVINSHNIELKTSYRVSTDISSAWYLINGKITQNARIVVGVDAVLCLIDTEYELTGLSARTRVSTGGRFEMRGGVITFTAATDISEASTDGTIILSGVDISGLTSAVQQGVGGAHKIIIKNCKTPATITLHGASPLESRSSVEVISSNNSTSNPNTSSIQDYQREDAYGTIGLETTIVRTGGADDGASGAFSYAMTPTANGTLESSSATLKSPWMSVWVAGGASKTLTVHVCNDGGVDYNENEMWVEFYTPDASDTAQHDQNFDPATARLFPSTTPITDDATSTWGGTGANGQKFSVTVTPGFEGWAYARLHVAKRQATPDTVYLDPKIVVT